MIEAIVLTATEEQELLKEWFETVHFDVESEGIPPLAPERDDEESRSIVDSEAITDWFRGSPVNPVPVAAMDNDDAWTYVDWSIIGMAPSVARGYMEGEARFQELSRANPYHSKKNGQFAKAPGGGGAPKVSTNTSRVSTSVANSTVDKRVQELQAKEPEKYWKVAETHEGAESFRLSNSDGSTAGHYAMYNRTDHVEFGTLVAEPGQRGIAKSALDDLDQRVPDKVQRLDAFDGDLTAIYAKYGFKETDRVKWDDQYAPKAWKPEYGRPDVVFMERPSAVDRGVETRANPNHDKAGKFAKRSGAGIGTDQSKWAFEQNKDLNEGAVQTLAYGDFNDPVSRPLVAVAGRQGFDALPKKGSVDDTVKAGGIEIHRGITSHDGSGTSAEAIENKTLNGPYEPGKGNYGNGYYFSTSSGIANMYANAPVADKGYNAKAVAGGRVIRAALPKNAKIGDYEQIKREHQEWYAKNRDNIHWDTYATDFIVPPGKISPTVMDAMNDPGHFAALMGYDAIRVPLKDRANDRRNKARIKKKIGSDDLGDEIVVLNRGALVVDG